MKTDYLKFKKQLESTAKTYFSLADLKKYYSKSPTSFKVLLSNWNKKKLIHSLGYGFYAFNLNDVDYLHLAGELDKNSYISFEYALFLRGLINQMPSIVTSATKNRSRLVVLPNFTFEYSHLKDELFFGYDLKNKIYLATPEKALADSIYLISRGKRLLELDTLAKEKINQKKFHQILKKFPKYTAKKAKELKLL